MLQASDKSFPINLHATISNMSYVQIYWLRQYLSKSTLPICPRCNMVNRSISVNTVSHFPGINFFNRLVKNYRNRYV